MRSIPAALTWEIIRHQWASFGAVTLAMIALPGIIFTALTFEKALDPKDASSIMLHFTMLVCQLMVFGPTIGGAMQGVQRLYVLPATSSTLVMWRMIPAMALSATMYFVTAAVLNSLFSVDWPLWGPMLFHATSVAWLMACIWLGGRTVWIQVVALGAVSVPLFFWLKTRYGGTFGQPDHLWTELTSGEALAMLAMIAGALTVAHFGAVRDRCGETFSWPRLLAILDWIDGVLESRSATRLGTPARAQFWFEWRQKGYLMPGLTVMTLLVAFVFWLYYSRSIDEMGTFLAVFPFFLANFAVFMGMVSGQCSPAKGRPEIGNYLATRPVTDAGIAFSIFKSYSASALTAWGIWAVIFLIVGLVRSLFGVGAVPPEGSWRVFYYLSLSLPGIWLIGTITGCVIMSGRPSFWASLFLGAFSLTISGIILDKWVLPQSWTYAFEITVLVGIGAAATFGTIIAFVVALRWAKIPSSVALAGLLVWSALVLIYFVPVYFWLDGNADSGIRINTAGLVFFASLSPLLVLPLAAGPLAVAWNRHR